MFGYQVGILLSALLAFIASAEAAETGPDSLLKRHWFEARTAHFNTYSCGATQEVAKLTARLEQFREAYSMLAGAQAVASPPIVVMAFPDHAAMEPFLPVYKGQPANLAAFFHRGSDENLIVLSLSESGSDSLPIIFHEYTHLLLRHNEQFWPLWLKEGMAEIYSTFEVTGSQSVRIGKPIPHHLHLLAHEPLMPLKELFAVGHDSPNYNEREHQGIFYAESWLLTHYLMLGRNGANKASFGQLTSFLRQGQTPAQAFTNALRTPLPAMEIQLRRYVEGGKFDVQPLSMRADLYASRTFTTRGLAPVEVCFRLGDQLMRVGRPDAAESYFVRGQKLAPRSPLPYEGLGILAASRGQHAEAVRDLNEALQRGSVSFLAHYAYAREKYQLTADGSDRYTAIGPEPANEIRAELQKSLGLMPDFGPAHRLLGFFEMAQGDNLIAAEQHLVRAIQLEPENLSYRLSLAQAQLRRSEVEAARLTLAPLRLSYVEPTLRAHAEEMLKEIGKHER